MRLLCCRLSQAEIYSDASLSRSDGRGRSRTCPSHTSKCLGTSVLSLSLRLRLRHVDISTFILHRHPFCTNIVHFCHRFYLKTVSMSDLPPLVHESISHSPSAPDRDFSSSCPFCYITEGFEPVSPMASSETAAPLLNPEKLDPPSFVLYSGEHVIAFLDIMPLTRGHVLVAPRKHRVKIGDLSPDEGAEVSLLFPHCSLYHALCLSVLSLFRAIHLDNWLFRTPLFLPRVSVAEHGYTYIQIGRVLPILARSVLKAVLPDIPHEDADYNVVQNNGKCSSTHHHSLRTFTSLITTLSKF